MNPFLGTFLILCGGFSAGSFYVPLRKVKQWSWESYWLAQGFMSWLILPWLVAYLTTPQLLDVFSDSPAKNIIGCYIFGLLWGTGGVTFGLAIRYLGISLGYAMALGLCTMFGTLIPPLFMGELLSFAATLSGKTVLTGLVICLAGIGLCGYAGIRKEKELTPEEKKNSIREFSLKKGFLVAIISGIMNSCLAFGYTAGTSIAQAAVEHGTADVCKNNPLLILMLGGGFTFNLIFCLMLNFMHKSFKEYTRGGGKLLISNYILSFLAGVVWYAQLLFYGMGNTKMGKYAFSSWTAFIAFIIVFSNLWGIIFKEWKGVSKKTWSVLCSGLAVLILSAIVIGWGNYLGG